MLIATILKQDGYMIRGWVRTRAVTKLFVMLGFLAVLSGIGVGIYLLAKFYFVILSGYGVYGQAVATYSISASLVVLFWLSLLTSTLAAYPMLYLDTQLRQWLTLPLEPLAIFRANFAKLLLATGWAVVIVLWPILKAYGETSLSDAGLPLRGIVVIGLLIILSQSLGAFLSLWASKTYGRLSQGSLILWLSMLLFLMFITGKILFPPAFFKLAEAPDWQSFQTSMGNLPIVTGYLPTSWLAETLTRGWSWLSVLSGGLTIGCWWLMDRHAQKHYLHTWFKAQEHPLIAGNKAGMNVKRHFPLMDSGEMSLLVNDWLAVARNTSELIYFLFVLGLGAAFYLIIRTIPVTATIDSRWLHLIQISAMAGYLYLVIVVAGRFMYPLMAKEAHALWFLFSAPIERTTLFSAKLLLASLYLIPWFCLALMTASALNLAEPLMWVYALLLVYGAVTIAVVHVTLGVMAPNFAEGERPDAASTSASGMAALGLSLAVTALGIETWQLYIKGNQNVIWWFCLGAGVLAVIMILSARSRLAHYETV